MSLELDHKDLLKQLYYFCENRGEIPTAIAYATKLLEVVNIPDDVKLEIENDLTRCKLLQKKYSSILQRNYTYDVFKRKLMLANFTLDADMSFIFIYLIELDLCLMDYGEGPQFYEDDILEPQPPTV